VSRSQTTYINHCDISINFSVAAASKSRTEVPSSLLIFCWRVITSCRHYRPEHVIAGVR